jgi:hypothetical protein
MEYLVVKNMKKSLNEYWKPGDIVSNVPYSTVNNLLSLGWIKLKEEGPEEKASSEKKQVKKKRGRPRKQEV